MICDFRFLTVLSFSDQLPLIPQTDRAYKPGESCGPLSEGSWCLWGEFGGQKLHSSDNYCCLNCRSLFTCTQSLFILCRMRTASVRQLNFWEKPPDFWSGWKGKGTESNTEESSCAWLHSAVLCGILVDLLRDINVIITSLDAYRFSCLRISSTVKVPFH